jgi:hypothetical protein
LCLRQIWFLKSGCKISVTENWFSGNGNQNSHILLLRTTVMIQKIFERHFRWNARFNPGGAIFYEYQNDWPSNTMHPMRPTTNKAAATNWICIGFILPHRLQFLPKQATSISPKNQNRIPDEKLRFY